MLRRTLLSLPLSLPAVSWAQSDAGSFVDLNDWRMVGGPESAFTVEGREVAVHSHASFPAWLRSARQYENFELEAEFLIKGWTDSGLYLRAAEHGRPSETGLQIKIFHQKQDQPESNSMGAVFPVVAPRKINVKDGWNTLRVRCDGPQLQVWTNGEIVQDLNLDQHNELRWRLRRGYIGFAGASADCRFRNLRIRELPSTDRWQVLYGSPADLDKWVISEGKPDFVALGNILRGDGAGHLATKEKFLDFRLQCSIRGSAQHNGGVLFRSSGRGQTPEKHYEIQLHPVEEAHFPTGSLYNIRRAKSPRIPDGQWFFFDLWVKGKEARVRIDGETVMEYAALENLDPGFIELQAHRRGYWIEFQDVRVQRL